MGGKVDPKMIGIIDDDTYKLCDKLYEESELIDVMHVHAHEDTYMGRPFSDYFYYSPEKIQHIKENEHRPSFEYDEVNAAEYYHLHKKNAVFELGMVILDICLMIPNNQMMQKVYIKNNKIQIDREALSDYIDRARDEYQNSRIITTLLTQMLEFDPQKRPTATEALKTYHDLFKEQCKSYKGGVKNPKAYEKMDRAAARIKQPARKHHASKMQLIKAETGMAHNKFSDFDSYMKQKDPFAKYESFQSIYEDDELEYEEPLSPNSAGTANKRNNFCHALSTCFVMDKNNNKEFEINYQMTRTKEKFDKLFDNKNYTEKQMARLAHNGVYVPKSIRDSVSNNLSIMGKSNDVDIDMVSRDSYGFAKNHSLKQSIGGNPSVTSVTGRIQSNKSALNT